MFAQPQLVVEAETMTSTGRSLGGLLTATSLLVAVGLVAAPLATATTSVAPLAAHAKTGHAKPARANTATTATSTSSNAAAVSAAAATDYSSIFSGTNDNLANSGWTTCPAPIAWTVDTRGLTADQSAAQLENLQWAFGVWSAASGLVFQYSGTQDVTYDDAAFTVVPADGSGVQRRHIYLDFVAPTESARLAGNTVGLGSPSQVMASTKEIVAGEAVFRTDHVKSASTVEVRSLYIHELGHVLGLAHANVTANVMYPIVTETVNLGSGDVNGVRTMTKPCNAAA
jgi:hypothetical protein